MAGNTKAIDTLVLPEAFKQVADLKIESASLRSEMTQLLETAIKLNAALGGSTASTFAKNAKASTEATEKLISNSNKQIEIENKRIVEQEKAYNKYLQLLAKQQAERDKSDAKEIAAAEKKARRLRIIQESTAAEIAAQQNEIATQERLIATTNASTGANETNAASLREEAAAAAQAEASAEAYRISQTRAGAAAATAAAEVNAATAATAANSAAATNSAANIGRSLTRGLGYLRTIAYILPGIGIAGIFNLAFEGIMKAVSAMGLFADKVGALGGLLKNFNEVNKQASEEYGQQATRLRVLYGAATDLNNSMHNRLLAVLELKKEFPNEFENLKTVTILNGEAKDSYDSLRTAILENAMAKASLSKIEKLAGAQVEADIQKQKINIAEYNELAKLREQIAGGTTFDVEGGGILEGNAEKQIKDRANKSRAEQDRIRKDAQRQIDFLTKLGGGNDKMAEELSKGNGKKLFDQTNKDAKNFNNDLLENNKLRLEEQQKLTKLILDDETIGYQTRMDALKAYLATSQELLENGEQIALRQVGLRSQQKLNIELDYENKSTDLKREGVNQTEKLNQEELQRHKKILEEMLTASKESEQEQLENLNQGAIVAAQVLQDGRDKLINEKTLQYSQGKLSEKQYNRDLLLINDEYNVQRIAQELAVQQTILAIKEGKRDVALADARGRGATPEELSKITSDANKGITGTQNNIASLTGQLGNAKAKQGVDLVGGSKEDLAKKKKAVQVAFEYAKDTANQINNLIDAGYNAQISKLDAVGKKIQENADIEKAAIDRSLDTQANKARKQADLDARVASEQKALQQQINEEKRKEAIANKIGAVAEIILNTAVAATKVTAQAGLLGLLTGVPAVITLGAIQLAAALATPIPQFEKGGIHKGGLMIVGEKGPEPIKVPGLPEFLSPGVPTLMSAPAGTRITPNNMLPQTPKWISNTTDNSGVISAINNNTAEVKRGNSKHNGNSRVNGWLAEQRIADQWNSYSRNHFK